MLRAALKGVCCNTIENCLPTKKLSHYRTKLIDCYFVLKTYDVNCDKHLTQPSFYMLNSKLVHLRHFSLNLLQIMTTLNLTFATFSANISKKAEFTEKLLIRKMFRRSICFQITLDP